jgi:hypothetical protein
MCKIILQPWRHLNIDSNMLPKLPTHLWYHHLTTFTSQIVIANNNLSFVRLRQSSKEPPNFDSNRGKTSHTPPYFQFLELHPNFAHWLQKTIKVLKPIVIKKGLKHMTKWNVQLPFILKLDLVKIQKLSC